jgi:hypothetical protein
VEAALGRKEEAIKAGQNACELLPFNGQMRFSSSS